MTETLKDALKHWFLNNSELSKHPILGDGKREFFELLGKVEALESRNSSALKALRKKVQDKIEEIDSRKLHADILSSDMKRMLLSHYDLFLSEIDSLLQQEGLNSNPRAK